jgi:hypothetical protein
VLTTGQLVSASRRRSASLIAPERVQLPVRPSWVKSPASQRPGMAKDELGKIYKIMDNLDRYL